MYVFWAAKRPRKLTIQLQRIRLRRDAEVACDSGEVLKKGETLREPG